MTAAAYNCTDRKNTYLNAKRQNLHVHVFFLNYKTLKYTTGKPKQILMKREFQATETLLINMELVNNGPPIYITQPLKIMLTNTSGHEYMPPI